MEFLIKLRLKYRSPSRTPQITIGIKILRKFPLNSRPAIHFVLRVTDWHIERINCLRLWWWWLQGHVLHHTTHPLLTRTVIESIRLHRPRISIASSRPKLIWTNCINVRDRQTDARRASSSPPRTLIRVSTCTNVRAVLIAYCQIWLPAPWLPYVFLLFGAQTRNLQLRSGSFE